MTATARARSELRKAASVVHAGETARVVARAGLFARAAFYLLVASLVVRVAVDGGGGGPQANPNGALSVVAGDWLGSAAIAAAGVGFFGFGIVRIAGAARDRRAPARKRLLTLAQGLFYVSITWVPLSFLLGSRQAGSEQRQHDEAARLFGWPGGRELVATLGVVVLVVCAYQIWTAVDQDFADGLDLRRGPRWSRGLVSVAGTVGIAARALVFLPIGGLLVVAAVRADPAQAKGLDGELASLAGHSWWGPTILFLVATGLVIFAVYSGLEGWLRRVDRA